MRLKSIITEELTYQVTYEVTARQATAPGLMDTPDGVKEFSAGDWLVTREDGLKEVLSDQEFWHLHRLVGDDNGEMAICIGCERPTYIENLVSMGDEDACRSCYADFAKESPTTNGGTNGSSL